MVNVLWFRLVPLENSRNKGNSEKVVPFSGLGRPEVLGLGLGLGLGSRMEIRFPFTSFLSLVLFSF